MCRLRSIALGLLVVVCLQMLGTQPVFAEAARDKVNRLQSELDKISKGIEADTHDIGKQKQVRTAYQQQQKMLRQQIKIMNAQIVKGEENLTQKQVDVDEKILDVATQRALFEQRLVAQYTNREQDDLAYLLGVADWKTRLRFQENLQCIAVQDAQIEQTLRLQQAELGQHRQEKQAVLIDLERQRTALADKVDELAASIRQTDANISDAQAHLDAQSTAYGQTQEELEQAQAELQQWLTANSKVNFAYGGGVFAWPLPGYAKVSSDFGWRKLWGYRKLHRGIDFPAPAGAPIVAAENGLVGTTAHWSYGTCVKINHGSGLLSLYAHMSARAEGIKDGKFVNKGDVIGYVGSTGRSGGDHLHFEVNLDNAVMNPWKYLNK